MIGGPPIGGAHPPVPQPAPQRPGIAAIQTSAPMAPQKSASLRMVGTPLTGAGHKKGWVGTALPCRMRGHPASGPDHSRARYALEEQVPQILPLCTTYNPWLQLTTRVRC